MMKKLFVASLVATLLIALTLPAGAIINGQPDEGEHPYVGLVVFDLGGVPAWRCTGSLLSSTVVLTAGHCTEGAEAARFWVEEDLRDNEEFPGPGDTSVEGLPITGPDYALNAGAGLHGFLHRDIAVVLLDEPVTLDRYAQLPKVGFVDTLPNRTPVTIVGYGVQEQILGDGGQPYWVGELHRLKAEARTLTTEHRHGEPEHRHGEEVLRLSSEPSQGQGGTCFGDSGGPVLLAGTDTVIGVTSYGPNFQCTGPGYYSRTDIAGVLDWLATFPG
jgi:secreted trypsin-like serine protease